MAEDGAEGALIDIRKENNVQRAFEVLEGDEGHHIAMFGAGAAMSLAHPDNLYTFTGFIYGLN